MKLESDFQEIDVAFSCFTKSKTQMKIKSKCLPSPWEHVRCIYKFSPHTACSTHYQLFLFISALKKKNPPHLLTLQA